jgi:hypothetical protein
MPVSRNAPDVLMPPQATAAASHAPDLVAIPAFIALSQDEHTCEAIRTAVADRGTLILVATAEAFAEQLVIHAGAIGILDLSLVPGSGLPFIARLHAQFPGLVLVALGTARDQSALAPLVTDGRVCRFASKPISTQRLALFLDATLRRRNTIAHEQESVPGSASARPGGWRIAALALLFIVGAGTLMWLFGAQSATTPPAASAQVSEPPTYQLPPVAIPTVTPNVPPLGVADAMTEAQEDVLIAQRLMEAGFLIDPPENSARSHIEAATRLAPDDPEVRRTARALSERLVDATRDALLARDVTAAEYWIEAARSYGVSTSILEELDKSLAMLKGMLDQ